MPRRAWLVPGRRQTILVAVLIVAAGASLLLLPSSSRSYRAVATAAANPDAPDCLRAAPEHVADGAVQRRAASTARIRPADVERATEVLPARAGVVLAVAFTADTGYAAQRGAYSTVSQAVGTACQAEGARLLTLEARAQDRARAAETAVRLAPAPAPANLVAARDSTAAAAAAASEAFARQSAFEDSSTTVTAADPLGSSRSRLAELGPPAGAAACVVLALAVLRIGWRRAAAPVPA